MLTKQMSIDYSKYGVRTISISPVGLKPIWAEKAKYEVSESVELFLARINQLPPESNGIFLGEDGEIIPW